MNNCRFFYKNFSLFRYFIIFTENVIVNLTKNKIKKFKTKILKYRSRGEIKETSSDTLILLNKKSNDLELLL